MAGERARTQNRLKRAVIMANGNRIHPKIWSWKRHCWNPTFNLRKYVNRLNVRQCCAH